VFFSLWIELDFFLFILLQLLLLLFLLLLLLLLLLLPLLIDNSQNINFGLELTSEESIAFIILLHRYKNVFTWKYDFLKTYDTSIIQHTIPMISEEKLVQQKLRKIHPNLENQIKTELNKLLKVKIIFPVRHSNWVSNMVPVRKKNGDIRICIDFRNLNKASQKDNFPLPTMEQTLHSVVGSELMSFLDGFSG